MTPPCQSHLSRALFALALLLWLEPPVRAQAEARPDGPPRGAAANSRADYEIRARVDPFTREQGGAELQRFRLAGALDLRWTNGSTDEVSDLRFHLYLNAFSNNRSLHMLETGADLRGQRTQQIGEEWWWGYQEVRSVRVAGVDVMPSLRYLRPAAAAPGEEAVPGSEDRTVFAVDAPRAIAPGETVEVEIEWESVLPRVRRRTGTKGDFLFAAHWFPKLGVYESGRGWNCHPFHAVTEFYADYGTYKVTLDLPRAYSERVGGSGVRIQDLVRGADRVEVVFEAPSRADRERADGFGKLPLVHDFAWTGDPSFVLYTDTFRPAEWMEDYPEEVKRAQQAFGPDVDLGMRDVAVSVLVQPEHAGQAQRHYHATAAALFFYGLWYGGYPYEHITVVDPAWGGRAAGGMEYPTLFTAGTRLFTTPDMHTPESVTVHEAGHQFWYGLVGSNEFEAAWLDEGFNSYTDSEVLWRVYGPQRQTTDYLRLPHDGLRPTRTPDGRRLARVLTGREWSLGFLEGLGPLDRLSKVSIDPLRQTGWIEWWRDQPLLSLVPAYQDPRWADRAGYLRDPASDPIDRPAFEYVDRISYRTNSYPRPAVLLRTLAGVVGQDAFLRGMRHYAREWRYRHPYPEDFYESFVEGSGVDVRWFFEDGFRSTKTIDWKVSVSQETVPAERGYFPAAAGEMEERGARERRHGEAGAEEGGSEGASRSSRRPRRVEIVLRREGEFCLPLAWRIRIESVSGALPVAPDEVRDFVWTREQQLEQAWLRMDFELPHDRRVAAVVLDPERLYYVDRNMSDNQWYAERDRVTPLRWTERVFHQYQHILHWFAGIGG